MFVNAGIDNHVLENVVSGNGAFGITHVGTNGTRIEGNLSNRNLGRYAGPGQTPLGHGIAIRTSTGLTVKGNSSFQNSGIDFFWDGNGKNQFTDNPGLMSMSALKLSNTTNTARNPAFRVGDSYRLEASNAAPNAPIYLHLFKDGQDLGVSGPYGTTADSQGQWVLTGTFDALSVGSWMVQALPGSPAGPNQTGVVNLTVSKPAP